MDNLYSEIKGRGRDVVLIHGWGMHGGIFGKFNDLLANDYQTHAIDLPGFGFSKDIKNDFTLDSLTEVIEKYINYLVSPVSLIGWSLGGLITQNILKRKNVDIDKVVLIASTPSFTKKEGWETAMDQSVFNGFSNDLKLDYKKTLKRFISLQTRGSNLARNEMREINEKLLSHGEPHLKALQKGLNILSSTDLRSESVIEKPLMIVLGERDTLVPLSVISEFKNHYSNLNELIIEKTGHAPFMSHPKLCAEKIKTFINE